ncbi:MAG: hypothetical protein Kow0032_22860 [Methyloligellaceae bacterium]
MPEHKTSETNEARAAPAALNEAQLQQALDLLARWNQELVSFYAKRYQQYGLLPLRLLSCTSLDDLQGLQREFAEQLCADYCEEAGKLSQIAATQAAPAGASADDAYAARLMKAQEDAAAILEEAKAQAEQIVESAREQVRAMSTQAQTEEPKQKRA